MHNSTQSDFDRHPPAIAAAVQERAGDIARLGVRVVAVVPEEFPEGWWGAYDHGIRTIGLRCTLAPIQARSTLAHELAHAKHGHHGHGIEAHEREAERTAAQQLIGEPGNLTRVAKDLNLTGALAIGLGVLPRDILAYLDADPAAAGAALLEAFRHSNGFSVPRPTEYLHNNPPSAAPREAPHEAMDADPSRHEGK
ncbi:hypothetical protein CGQ24_07445 [Arthrobacter sp. 7749]|nr:hypothetical protein CGQ24_07445 [Arthrobacter sp. 7749]